MNPRNHRYSALAGATPDEATRRATGFVPRLPPRDLEIPARLPEYGRVEFIRLIRSDRRLRVLTAEIELPPGVIHEYVTAVLDVGPQHLTVYHRGELLERLPSRSAPERWPVGTRSLRSLHDALSAMN